jgi:2-polyprenyl-6-methoxyphenol hydroxylase-like FAD-dependent oxidoreductase
VAGSTLAILLGRAGLSVRLYERHHFPREKACAEGLMPAGVGVLARLGLAEALGGAPFEGGAVPRLRPAHGRLVPASRACPSHGLGQRRLRLDATLFDTARSTPGVQAFEGASVEGPIIEGERVAGLVVEGRRCARAW